MRPSIARVLQDYFSIAAKNCEILVASLLAITTLTHY